MGATARPAGSFGPDLSSDPTTFASGQPAQRAEVRSRWHGDIGLVEYRFDPGTELPEHGHPWASLNWMIGGGLVETVGREGHSCAAGATIFRPPATEHGVRVGPAGARAFHLEIGPSWIARGAEIGSLDDSVTDHRRGPLHHVAARLHAELLGWDDSSPLVVEGLLLELLGLAARVRRRERRRPGWLEDAVARLEESREPVTAADLADELDVHPVSLARTFRRHQGESVGEYGMRVRLAEAHRMVSTSDRTIADIAHALGFSDHAHLTRRFKRLYGLPPSRLRRSRAR